MLKNNPRIETRININVLETHTLKPPCWTLKCQWIEATKLSFMINVITDQLQSNCKTQPELVRDWRWANSTRMSWMCSAWHFEIKSTEKHSYVSTPHPKYSWSIVQAQFKLQYIHVYLKMWFKLVWNCNIFMFIWKCDSLFFRLSYVIILMTVFRIKVQQVFQPY